MMKRLLLLLVPLLGVMFSSRLLAEEPVVRLISCGWNAPTLGQFARDVTEMGEDGLLTGAVVTLHSDRGRPDPLATAHDTSDWTTLEFDRSVRAMAEASKERLPDNYLLLKANPGNVDWLDDQGWETIVQHYRIAADLAKRAGLRGLLVDFEPYTPPWHQFQFAKQKGADEASFVHYQKVSRDRGRQVMRAVRDVFPDAEVCTFFMLSYLIEDHHFRGPSPVGRSDAQWCLEGHAYGLLPSFIDGWLDALGPDMLLIDGCENAYWFRSEQQFTRCAHGVRERGVQLVSPENREKYRRQVQVAFPIFLDAIHPTFAGRYTLQPEVSDRLSLLRRNLRAAADAGDGLVWLYGEHGRWWPEAGKEALWTGKDTYPHWEQQLPGITEVIREFRAVPSSKRKGAERKVMKSSKDTPGNGGSQKERGKSAPSDSQPGGQIGATVIDVKPVWSSELEDGQGTVVTENGQVTITAATVGTGVATIETEPDRQYMIQVQVIQQGRGMVKMSVDWHLPDAEESMNREKVIAYPPPGDFEQARTITAVVRSPDVPHRMRVRFTAMRQVNDQDAALFGNLLVGLVDQPTPKKQTDESP